MRQRVAFARTLLAGRPVLCLDEPFGALDAITRADAQAWLAAALEREPRTVLLVTHDVEEALVLADRVVVLSPRPGRVVADLAGGRAAPAPAHRPRDRRAARAGAGGAAAMIWALLLVAALARRLAALRRASAASSEIVLPRPDDVADALVGDAGLLWDNFQATAIEVAGGIAVALVARRAARASRCTSSDAHAHARSTRCSSPPRRSRSRCSPRCSSSGSASRSARSS